jgi:ribonucleoside-diphosphate reductase alpha chain
MRNSNTMAIAPTATISNIADSYPCIEAIYKNIYVKANMSGEFTIVNAYLVDDLKARGLWSPEMLDKLKYYDGNLSLIAEIPQDLKDLHKEAFEIDPLYLLEMTARRGKWIDQSQSHNVFMKGTSGKMMEQIYMHAWKLGLKTTYYLRTLAASQIEKSTLDAAKYGFTQKRVYQTEEQKVENPEPGTQKELPFKAIVPVKEFEMDQDAVNADGIKLCKVEDPDCEACQ